MGETKSNIYKVDLIQFNNLSLDTGVCEITLPDGSQYKGEFVRKNKNSYILEGRGTLVFPNK